jgi:hypothetical protein
MVAFVAVSDFCRVNDLRERVVSGRRGTQDVLSNLLLEILEFDRVQSVFEREDGTFADRSAPLVPELNEMFFQPRVPIAEGHA